MSHAGALVQADAKQGGGTHTVASSFKCWGLQIAIEGAVQETHGPGEAMEREACEAARRLNLRHLKLVDNAR